MLSVLVDGDFIFNKTFTGQLLAFLGQSWSIILTPHIR